MLNPDTIHLQAKQCAILLVHWNSYIVMFIGSNSEGHYNVHLLFLPFSGNNIQDFDVVAYSLHRELQRWISFLGCNHKRHHYNYIPLLPP